MKHIKYIFLPVFLILFVNTSIATNIYISEVFYDTPLSEHPTYSKNLDGTTWNATHNGEYIELYNPTSSRINISGWTIKGHYPREIFTFPDESFIEAKSYVLVVHRSIHSKQFRLSTILPDLLQYEYSGKIFYQNWIKLSNRGKKTMVAR